MRAAATTVQAGHMRDGWQSGFGACRAACSRGWPSGRAPRCCRTRRGDQRLERCRYLGRCRGQRGGFENYVLRIDWRFKRTAGSTYNAKLFDADGNVIGNKPVKNADSGIFVRGSGKSQVNLWCWPCGSGQLWSFHGSKDPAIRKGALPKLNADKPVGEWNEMEITIKGESVTIILNDKTVLDQSKMPGVGTKGPIALQHHGGYNKKNKTWSSASALIQFRNIKIKEL